MKPVYIILYTVLTFVLGYLMHFLASTGLSGGFLASAYLVCFLHIGILVRVAYIAIHKYGQDEFLHGARASSYYRLP